mmetsp:Transcript_22439/g.57316  ORF Transcript_22439/g.57316 Transcript_22439/m.57316 type:complete len:386 (-) Transcript_22439:44-1201(-)|eukprot:CAMPEP_0183516570 /NCGR_PEP_ID=MMETSP0371-20130417/14300_1 /TAXON_ID=268820 /ORGANISM="Peridinium aciculiferum, Strain PAER-2" /LENGTH=385 /DNA_ID=CAMNT_0025714327 /DNA_START=51 /DNA_END=1208 /DNA_ORIENTATION=+
MQLPRAMALPCLVAWALASGRDGVSAAVLEPIHAPTAARLKVQKLHGNLEKVLNTGALSAALAKEAKHVQEEADKALASQGVNETQALKDTLVDYHALLVHLSQREASLRGGGSSASAGASAMEARAAKLLPKLQANAEKILRDLSDDHSTTGQEDAARVAVVKSLQAALATSDKGVTEKVLALHGALVGAQGVLKSRTVRLAGEEAELKQGLEEQQLWLLYKMLLQRKTLPMETQVAMLHRPQFENCSYTKNLLNSHDNTTALVWQLEALLPKSLALKLHPASHKKDHLAPGGSDGTVHVVSSRMKNAVRDMTMVLKSARDKLEHFEQHPTNGTTPQQLAQGKTILGNLDHILVDLGKTNDLSKQLGTMDEVERQLQGWMTAAK